MKKKKSMFFYLPILLVAITVLIIYVLFSRQSIQKNVLGEELNGVDNWKKIMADSANKSEIVLKVNKTKIDLTETEAYMSDNMNLMVPVNIVQETFNCAQYVYDNKKVIIEKGSNVGVMYIGERKLLFNDNEFRLDDKVTRKEETIYVPVTVFTDYFNYKYRWDSTSNTVYLTDSSVGSSYFPERYSYIDKKRAVPPKDQGNIGTCWAFATLTALETSLTPEESLDFSENNLVFNNEMSADIQDGGDYMMSMAYLMAWKGPVLEKDDPYGSKNYNKDLKPVKHVQEAQIIPEKNYDQIKEMVYKYGGVESSMYMSMNNHDMSSVYYNDSECAYCYKGKNKPNHDVVIIGWDDNFSKELFNDQSIEGDGAFICMNSWGESFGDKGVFYISYYDDCIGMNNVCYTGVEKTDNFANIYQSDLCGWTGSMGFEGQDTAYFANVYTAEETENLEAVGFYATVPGLKYEVFICNKYKNTSTLNNRNHIAAKGTLDNKGYYTIKLDRKYRIKKDERFAVIVKVINEKNNETFKIIPVEMETEYMVSKVDLSDGEGYFSSMGANWRSAEKEKCNICLKAYTNK